MVMRMMRMVVVVADVVVGVRLHVLVTKVLILHRVQAIDRVEELTRRRKTGGELLKCLIIHPYQIVVIRHGLVLDATA
jgi:hypothetical protein